MIRHPLHVLHGNSYLLSHSHTTSGELADDRHAAVNRLRTADQEIRCPRATVYPFTRFFSEEVVRPRRGHRLGSSDTGRSLRSVTGMVRSVWHLTVGRIE